MGGVGGVARLHVQPQGHAAAADGGEGVRHFLQLAGHQGEQIGGLGEGVVPDGVVAPARQGAGLQTVAVAEQHRTAGPLGLDAHPEAAEQVGAVGVEGDAAEALGLALGGEQAAAQVEALQGGVGLRVYAHPALQHERLPGWLGQQQAFAVEGIGRPGKCLAVELEVEQLQLEAPQPQRTGFRLRVGPEGQACLHLGVVGMDAQGEIGALQQLVGGTVVGKTHRGHGGGRGKGQGQGWRLSGRGEAGRSGPGRKPGLGWRPDCSGPQPGAGWPAPPCAPLRAPGRDRPPPRPVAPN